MAYLLKALIGPTVMASKARPSRRSISATLASGELKNDVAVWTGLLEMNPPDLHRRRSLIYTLR